MEKQRDNPLRFVIQKIIPVLPPSILIVSNIFLFGPYTIYQGNITEFVISLTSILSLFAFPALILTLVLTGIGLLLSKELHRWYISILFVLGILIWFQGNILVWDYGLSDGRGVDWAKNVWRGWIDGTIWVVFLTLTVLFYKKIYKIAGFASIVLISLQLVNLGFMGVQKPEIWKKKELFPISPPEEIFEFSSKQNIIHVILDELQSDVFQEIIDEDVDYYYSALEGFTFFKDTIGPFPTTYMSIPAILSGQIYKNDIPMREFMNIVFEGRTITNVLYDRGYEVDFGVPYQVHYYRKGRYSNYYTIPNPYDSDLMLNLVLFRHAPHVLKIVVYNNYHNQLLSFIFKLTLPSLNLSKKEKTSYKVVARHFAHKAFLQDLIDNMSVNNSRKPVYKLFHLLTTHYPLVLNESCGSAGKILPWRWENIKIQAKCSFDHFMEFLDKLKLLGIYDSSLIIFHADHGYHNVFESINQLKLKNLDKQIYKDFDGREHFAKVVSSSWPVLAIKPPHSNGPLKISSAPAMLNDIPATISSILNLNEIFPGGSVFEIDSNEVRERRHIYYKRLPKKDDLYLNKFDKYIIKGEVSDRASWRLDKTVHPMNISYETSKVDFGTAEASRFLRFGWSWNETHAKEGYTLNWALGNTASIFLSLPKNEPVLLTANITSLPFSKGQHVTIMVDAKKVGTWELPARWILDKYSIVIEPDDHRPDVSIVEFIFSQHRKPEGNMRPLAVLFESLTLSKINEEAQEN